MGFNHILNVQRRSRIGWHMLVVGLTIASVAGAMAFSGCGGGSSSGLPPGAAGGRPRVAGGPPGGGAPNAPRRTVERTVVATGPKLALAEELVLAKTNPFLSKLPKINVSVAVAPDGSGTVAPVAIDPFAGVTLVGVLFNPKNAMALVSIGGSTSFLKKGDTFSTGASQVKVGKVTRESVELVTGNGEKTTLTLPNILGYQNIGGNPEFSPSPERTPQRGGSIVDKLNDIIDGSGPVNTSRGNMAPPAPTSEPEQDTSERDKEREHERELMNKLNKILENGGLKLQEP